MKLAIIGSREFVDFARADKIFSFFFKNKVKLIISGGAQGADTIAEQLAEKYSIKKKIHEAKWNDFSEPCKTKFRHDGSKYNALAGFKRNKFIVDDCDMVLAFWNGSSGTKDSLDYAAEIKKPVMIIHF